jgi:hypothetical protein
MHLFLWRFINFADRGIDRRFLRWLSASLDRRVVSSIWLGNSDVIFISSQPRTNNC